ncbi:MAG: hypothetical protein WCG45_05040 [bacterium]
MENLTLTKSGHEIKQQNCFNEYNAQDNKKYLGYEYYISDSSILYIYEDGELVDSIELRGYKDNNEVAKYFINRLHTGVII